MMIEWLTDDCHPQRVSKRVAVDNEVSFDHRHVLSGCSAGNGCRSEQDCGAGNGAFGYLCNSHRVGEDDFGPTGVCHAPEATLTMEQAPVDSVLVDWL